MRIIDIKFGFLLNIYIYQVHQNDFGSWDVGNGSLLNILKQWGGGGITSDVDRVHRYPRTCECEWMDGWMDR